MISRIADALPHEVQFLLERGSLPPQKQSKVQTALGPECVNVLNLPGAVDLLLIGEDGFRVLAGVDPDYDLFEITRKAAARAHSPYFHHRLVAPVRVRSVPRRDPETVAALHFGRRRLATIDYPDFDTIVGIVEFGSFHEDVCPKLLLHSMPGRTQCPNGDQDSSEAESRGCRRADCADPSLCGALIAGAPSRPDDYGHRYQGRAYKPDPRESVPEYPNYRPPHSGMNSTNWTRSQA